MSHNDESKTQMLVNKWKPLLEHAELPKIADLHRRNTVAALLENTEKALLEGSDWSPKSLMEANPINQTGNVSNYDPVLISLVRRAMPNLIAYDIMGVQPMTGPTGLVFAMRSNYANSTNAAIAEAFYTEADTGFSGTGVAAGTTGTANTANSGGGVTTANMEVNTAFTEMAFTIEQVSVTAKSRALKAEYSMELAQDLKAIHGLDAESELSNILSSEILAEINREMIRTLYTTSVTGSQTDTAVAGTFNLDVDANGRWSVEKFKGLMFQIEREANKIAKDTRRGKGNIILCSADVASALQMAGVLDYTPALNSNNLQVDDTGNTFAGVLNGRFKVYIDPYAGGNYLIVGYKGSNTFDAGLFYCPYVPLQMVRAVGENSFQPKIGFKTRYGVVANPYAAGATKGNGALTANTNVYYRRTFVTNLL
jgi:hypothetical protein